MSQDFSLSRGGVRLDGNDSTDPDISPPLRCAGDEQENFHFTSGVRINSDFTGESGHSHYRPVRKPTVAREGPAWESVIVAPGQEVSRGSKVTCKFCSKVYTATHNRIEEHVLGLGNISPCTGKGNDFENIMVKLGDELNKKIAGRARKRVLREMGAASEQQMPAGIGKQRASSKAFGPSINQSSRQSNIFAALDQTKAKALDAALADLSCGDNVPFHLVRASPPSCLALLSVMTHLTAQTFALTDCVRCLQVDSPRFKKFM
eukprot:5919924-Pleurochrysis_carterae.AAC.1